MSVGLVVGKFYPPHKGHKHLIDSARRQCDRLVVILAHHPSQQIPGELRKAWLEEIHPDCEVHLVPDELENDSEPWARWTIQYLGRAPDVVFSSEDYGPRYAALMGARHVMVDRLRETFPVSGTAVRQAPLAMLELLEPCVRAHFVRRVVLIGAESTGKTTLAARLAELLKTIWVPEYGRSYWEAKAAGWATHEPAWKSDEFLHIATEQQRLENQAARSANGVLVCDTNAFVTGTWHERYLGCRSAAVDEVGEADRAHLYLLTDLDVPFVQDGWRDGQQIRGWMHDRFVQQLTANGSAHLLLQGSWAQREQRALDAITRLCDDCCALFQ